MKEKNVIEYYVLCNKLKNVIRTGWKNWNLKEERLESVAEHVYATQMLALAMYSEYEYDLDIRKVLYMLAIHEIGETVIGDITEFQMDREEKIRIEREAVHKILGSLKIGSDIEELFLEFDNHETKEASFAYQCDKLECNLQCKLYDLDGAFDMNDRETYNTALNEGALDSILSGNTCSNTWIKSEIKKRGFDDNFKSILEYIMNNDISE